MEQVMEHATEQAKAPILSIRSLSKRLGGKQILDGIDLDVYPGEIYGFLGPNGSGKTTTIKLMLGLLKIEDGAIFIGGHNVSTDFEGAISLVGGIIENPEMYRYLTGRENLEQYARMCEGVDEARINEVVSLVGLDARIGDKISRYSLGMRQRLGVAQALLHRPRLLVLDEPTNGLDPAGIKELRDILKELCHKEQVAVFISSHLLSELEQLCDRVGVIDRGRMIGERSMAELQNSFGDGKVHLTVTVGDPIRAQQVATDAGLICIANEGAISLSITRESIPEFVRLLVREDLDLYEVTVQKKSLETAFLEMVGGTRQVGLGSSPEPAAAPQQSDPMPPVSGETAREEDHL
ncbi:MAG: ABC transporter ATP-binding protein [Clostridia bacterium]|nr:ABC transporter ATP-binding protein [Clostridia bacterium]